MKNITITVLAFLSSFLLGFFFSYTAPLALFGTVFLTAYFAGEERKDKAEALALLSLLAAIAAAILVFFGLNLMIWAILIMKKTWMVALLYALPAAIFGGALAQQWLPDPPDEY